MCSINCKLIHDLWHFGNPALNKAPYKGISGRLLRTSAEKKNASRAKKVVAAIDTAINNPNYTSLSSADRDKVFKNAFDSLVFGLARPGQQIKTNYTDMYYTSFYENYINRRI